MHKLTFESLASDVARTSAALPDADWNEQDIVAHPCAHHGHYRECPELIVETPEQPRTGRTTWGPRHAVVYAPRWSTDHHPWLVKGMNHAAGIRYANYEVDED